MWQSPVVIIQGYNTWWMYNLSVLARYPQSNSDRPIRVLIYCCRGTNILFIFRVLTTVWRTRVCGPACCQMAVLYRKPTVSLPARQEPTPGCKQSRPGRTWFVTTGVYHTTIIRINVWTFLLSVPNWDVSVYLLLTLFTSVLVQLYLMHSLFRCISQSDQDYLTGFGVHREPSGLTNQVSRSIKLGVSWCLALVLLIH